MKRNLITPLLVVALCLTAGAALAAGETGMLADQLERLGATVNRKIGDDGFNGFLRGRAAELMAKAQLDEARAQGATLMYTHFIANTVMPDPHNVLSASIENKTIRDWLFSQSK
jgi:hypothetical protein